eukprot:Sdes_comp20173_c0_seq1m13385
MKGKDNFFAKTLRSVQFENRMREENQMWKKRNVELNIRPMESQKSPRFVNRGEKNVDFQEEAELTKKRKKTDKCEKSDRKSKRKEKSRKKEEMTGKKSEKKKTKEQTLPISNS